MLTKLEPKFLWQHFDQLRQIPRPSKHEAAVRDHIKRWAADRKFETAQDKVGNLCVSVPATKGHEKAPIVIIQGHLDMVPEKDKATTFDFTKDPIQCRVDGDWVVADHTTLGADNGIGLAAGLASADDPSAVHGPLELLFTVDEETGLTGASDLDAGVLLKGKLLLNLDSEEDGVLFVGCAGGCNTMTTFDLERVAAPANHTALRIEASGLKGGHSGLNIHENRGNSIKIVSRVLTRWFEKTDVLVVSFDGGNKHNAIPREAVAVVLVPSSFVDQARTIAANELKSVLTEYMTIDPGLKVTVEKVDAPASKPVSAPCTRRLVAMLLGIPHGVVTMSRDIAGLTETSNNLAIINTVDDHVEITTSSRSSVAAGLRGVLDQVNAVVNLAGGKPEEVGAYPPWQPNMESRLLQTCKSVFNELYGKEPKVTAIHAGLECGIIGEKIGGEADMISFGPQLEGVHAPGEKVCISSVARFWDFYKQVLKQLA